MRTIRKIITLAVTMALAVNQLVGITSADEVNLPEQEELMLGDVTLNEVIDIKDLTCLARHVAMIETLEDYKARLNADVDQSEGVDIKDLTKLARFVAEIENYDTYKLHTHNWTSKKIHHNEEGHYNIEKSPVYIQITTTGRKYKVYLDNYAEVCYNILKPLGLWKKEYISGNINNVYIKTGWEDYYEDESGIYYCFYTGNDTNCNYFDTTWKYADKYAFGTCDPVDLYDREYNSWSELEKDADLYMTDFGIDVSRYKNHQYEIKTWVVDKAAYDETIYVCSECGATK